MRHLIYVSKTCFGGQFTTVYLFSVLDTRAHEREPQKKKKENVLIPPANLLPVVCARENLSYSKKEIRL